MDPGMRGMGAIGWRRQDASVVHQKLAKGTLRRIAVFARPYLLHIAVFLVLVVIGAVLVTTLALIVALLAVFEAVLGLTQRWFSARIGEGLIYDLRTKVFGHVQRMPIAFFTRTQTGALVSRLNNDVIGAQQAFTSTLSGVVSNIISLILVVGAMMALSWQLTVVAVLLLPVFLLPARLMGRRLASMTREQMTLNADMSTAMTERFSVGGALLVTLFGRPETEQAGFAERAGRVRDLGIRIAMLGRVFFTALTLVAALATALVYGVGGNLAVDQTLTVGTLLALVALLGRLYGPLTALSNVRVDVMTALVSFERVFEVLDLEPMIRDAADATDLPAGAASVEFDRVAFTYPSAQEISLASLESVAVLDKRVNAPVLRDVRRGPRRRARRARGDARVAAPRDRVRHPGRAHVPRHDPRQPRLRPAVGDGRGDGDGAARGPDLGPGRRPARRSRHRRRRPRLPPVRWRAAAAGDRQVVAQGTEDRRARRGHRTPGLGVRGRRPASPRHRAGGPHLAGDRAPAVHGPQRRPDPGRRRRRHRRTRHPRRAAGPRRPLRRPLPHPVHRAHHDRRPLNLGSPSRGSGRSEIGRDGVPPYGSHRVVDFGTRKTLSRRRNPRLGESQRSR